MKLTQLCLAGLLTISTPALMAAQSPAPRIAPAASVLFRPSAVPDGARPMPMALRGHGERGAIIGAVVLGVGGAFIGNGTCEDGEKCTGTTIGFTALGVVIGAVLGAFIGGNID